MGYDKVSRRVIYITGSRADYGLMRNVLKVIDSHPELELELIVTGMHLLDEFGHTIDEIRQDGFNVHRIDSTYEKDDKKSMTLFVGDFIKKLSEEIEEIDPDFILLLGDRGEMLGGVVVGCYMSITNVHLHGGEITSTVDEMARHAITKLSNVHLPASEKSADRIRRMGEDPDHIHVVGAPGLDSLLNEEMIPGEILAKKYDFDLSEPLIIVVQHPVTLELENAEEQIRATLEMIKELEYRTILVYPNADAGGRRMIDEIKKFEDLSFLSTYKSIPRKDFISLLSVSDVLVGNSSSGIIEAPSLGLPVVNIGTRQRGRERAANVMDVEYDKKEIKKAVEKCLFDESFKDNIKDIDNPYGDGKTAERVARILVNIKIDEDLLQKKLRFI
ncbi:MAG: UDP-N-acetylglucosamine 2-epimerase [Thermoplasmatota archaeon]